MHKGYVGKTGEQVHYRQIGNGDRPLICLPPAPHTGAYFETLMPQLGRERHIIAVDYPGYGGSDRLTVSPSIKAYAERVGLGFDKFDLLGFHTGNLVALELALWHPESVGKIIMIDVPFFDPDTRKTYMSKLAEPAFPTSVEDGFQSAVTERHETISEARAFLLWQEKLRSGSHQNDAFRAAFNYDCDAQFPKLTHGVNVIATQSRLLEPTRRAARVLPNATLTERLDISAPVFEAHTQAIADAILCHI